MAQGVRVAWPFHFRWLLPGLCGVEVQVWRAVQLAALIGLSPLAFVYGGTGWRGLFCAVIPIGLAGIWTFNVRFPVLVDVPAMCVALAAAVCAQHDLWFAAVLLALAAGATKETAPVFAALWAWSPVPLLGLLVPAVRALQRAGDDPLDPTNRWILAHPWQASQRFHAGQWTNPMLWVWPWGACLLAFADATPQLFVTLAVAYAQCLVATDTVRLYQWAWPVLAVGAAGAVPPSWLLLAAIVHVANPWKGDGL